MTMSKKLYMSMGLAAVLGLVGAVGVLASTEQNAVAAAADDMQSWGATEVVADDPVEAMFSHKVHVLDSELECDACHPDIFQKKRGTARAKGDFTMDALGEGQYCGACHDGDMAFSVKDPQSCKNCHGSDMKQPKTIVFREPVKAVVFNHALHTGDLGLECSNCHTELFKMKIGDAESHPEDFTMKALYDGKYCGACHNGDDAFASNTKCTTCHIGVKGFERLFGSVDAEKSENEH